MARLLLGIAFDMEPLQGGAAVHLLRANTQVVAVLNEALLQGILQLWLRQRVALHVGTVQGLRCGSLRRRM